MLTSRRKPSPLRRENGLLIALLVLGLGACSPPQSGSAWEPNSRRDDANEEQEREANRVALNELMEASRQNEAQSTAADGRPRLEVVVVEPEPEGVNSDGSLQRQAVAAFVAGSPHQIIGAITFEPVHVEGEAYGYRILTFREHGAWLERAGLQVGDSVHTINGDTVLQPESVLRVWERLPEQDELSVVVLRDGRERTLRWEIREADSP
ncbi:MAG: type II secretory pathway component PulC [Bradymonadia bacterium]|jgi:type II secretory pathway component PulC